MIVLKELTHKVYEELKIVLSSILIYLLSHKHGETTVEGNDETVEGNDERDQKYFPRFIKMSYYYVGNSLILLGLMLKFQWKITFFTLLF